MPDRRDDDLDSWMDGRIDPLPPPPGTFELIKRRARRRKYRRLAVGVGAAAVVVAAAVTVPQVVNLPVLNPATATGVAANGRSAVADAVRQQRGERRVVIGRAGALARRGAGAGQLSARFGHVHRHAHRLGDRPGRDPGPLRHPVLHLGGAHRRRREDLDRGTRAADRPGRRRRRGEPDPVPRRRERLGVRAAAVRDARRRPDLGPGGHRRAAGHRPGDGGRPRVRAVRLLHRDRRGVRHPVHQLHPLLQSGGSR